MDETKPQEASTDSAYALAVLYTFGYLTMMAALMVLEIPTNNREIVISLVSIMSAAQLGIIKYYYDGSKGADKVQAANIARSLKSESVVQDIAKTAPAAMGVPIQVVVPKDVPVVTTT